MEQYTASAQQQLKNWKCAKLLATNRLLHKFKESLFGKSALRKFLREGPSGSLKNWVWISAHNFQRSNCSITERKYEKFPSPSQIAVFAEPEDRAGASAGIASLDLGGNQWHEDPALIMSILAEPQAWQKLFLILYLWYLNSIILKWSWTWLILSIFSPYTTIFKHALLRKLLRKRCSVWELYLLWLYNSV